MPHSRYENGKHIGASLSSFALVGHSYPPAPPRGTGERIPPHGFAIALPSPFGRRIAPPNLPLGGT